MIRFSLAVAAWRTCHSIDSAHCRPPATIIRSHLTGEIGKLKTSFFALLLMSLMSGPAFAFPITSELGNTTSGLVDGETYVLIPDIQDAQDGQDAPFESGHGNELLGPSFDEIWLHDFGAVADPIGSATVTIGIYGHDSASDGSQLASFGFDTTSLTVDLDDAFETSGGGVNEYNVYSVAVPASGLAELADGMASFRLELMGPGGEQCSIFPPFECSTPDFNGAHLIFSTVTIQIVPLPAAFWVFISAIGLLGIGAHKNRRRSSRRLAAGTG